MDKPIVPQQDQKLNNNLETFIQRLIELNLNLLSLNPKDICEVDENGAVRSVRGNVMIDLFKRIGNIAKLFKEHEYLTGMN